MNAVIAKLSDKQKSALYWALDNGGILPVGVRKSTITTLVNRGLAEKATRESEMKYVRYTHYRLTSAGYQFLSDNGSLGQFEQYADELTAVAFINAFFGIIPAQPDYSAMSMTELLDCHTHRPVNMETLDMIEGILRWDIDSVTDEELKLASDAFTDREFGAQITVYAQRELENRDNARRCPNCDRLKEDCEATGRMTQGSLYCPPEWVCAGKETY